MVEILALEEDACAADVLAQSGGLVQRRGPSGVVRLQVVEFIEECLVGAGLLVGRGDLFDDGHQCLGYVAAAEDTEVAARVRVVDRRLGDGGAGARQVGRGGVGHIRAQSRAGLSGPVSDMTDARRRSPDRPPRCAGHRW